MGYQGDTDEDGFTSMMWHLYDDYNAIPCSAQYGWSLVLLLMNNLQVSEIHEQEKIHFEI